jgi:hypothetical protein
MSSKPHPEYILILIQIVKILAWIILAGLVVMIVGSIIYISAANMMAGGSRIKKATTAALNIDLVKGGYKAYKKIKGNH